MTPSGWKLASADFLSSKFVLRYCDFQVVECPRYLYLFNEASRVSSYRETTEHTESAPMDNGLKKMSFASSSQPLCGHAVNLGAADLVSRSLSFLTQR